MTRRTSGRRDAASSPRTPKKRFKFLNPGDLVEVLPDEDSLRGAHLTGVLVGRSTARGCLVEYLVQSENSDRPLREWLPTRCVRPRPPPRPVPPSPTEDAAVDARIGIDDVWWLGVALGRAGGAPGKVRVCFPDARDVMEFDAADVRHHLEWVAGKWRSPNSTEIPNTMPYAKGRQIEVSKLEDDSVVAWSPAVVKKTIWKNNLLVDYTVSKCYGTTLSKEIVDVKHVRPCPPQASDISFCINDEVEALQGDCWWLGVITNCHPEFKYTFKSTHLGMEVEVNQKSLRLRYDWVDGQWESKNVRSLQACIPDKITQPNQATQPRIAELEKEVESLSHAARIVELEKEVESLSRAARIAELEKEVESLSHAARIAELDKEVESLSRAAQIAELEKEVESFGRAARIAELEKEVESSRRQRDETHSTKLPDPFGCLLFIF